MRPGRLQQLLEYGAAALLAAISLLTCAQVVFRYVLETPLAWSEELVRFLFVWLSFLGAALCFRRGGHFRLEFFTAAVPPKVARQIRVAMDVVVLAFALLLTVEGAAVLQFAFLSRYVALETSVGWSYLAIPAGGCLMVLYALGDLHEQVWRKS